MRNPWAAGWEERGILWMRGNLPPSFMVAGLLLSRQAMDWFTYKYLYLCRHHTTGLCKIQAWRSFLQPRIRHLLSQPLSPPPPHPAILGVWVWGSTVGGQMRVSVCRDWGVGMGKWGWYAGWQWPLSLLRPVGPLSSGIFPSTEFLTRTSKVIHISSSPHLALGSSWNNPPHWTGAQSLDYCPQSSVLPMRGWKK